MESLLLELFSWRWFDPLLGSWSCLPWRESLFSALLEFLVCLRLLLTLLMNNSFELFGFLNKDFYIAQMNYSWAMSKAVLDTPRTQVTLKTNSLFKANKTKNLKEDRTSVKKTTRATMTPQTPIPASNPILASMTNIYLKFNELKLLVKFIIKSN